MITDLIFRICLYEITNYTDKTLKVVSHKALLGLIGRPFPKASIEIKKGRKHYKKT